MLLSDSLSVSWGMFGINHCNHLLYVLPVHYHSCIMFTADSEEITESVSAAQAW